MGSAQSYLPQEPAAALTVVVVMGAIGLAYRTQGDHAAAHNSNAIVDPPSKPTAKKDKKKKKKPAKSVVTTREVHAIDEAMPSSKPLNVALPDVIPGQFDVKSVQPIEEPSSVSEGRASAFKKSRPKKAKASTSEETPRTTKLEPLVQTTSIDTDSSWMRVGSRRGENPVRNGLQSMDHSLGGTNITTSQTDTSSVASRTDDEALDSFLLQQHTLPSTNNRKTLAEKLLPKPRKTKVDDMLEKPGFPPLSRVMRVATSSNEDPSMDFSFAEYDDIPDTEGNDADGEDDGWGVVTRKRSKQACNTALPSSSQVLKPSEPLTKRQRQNAQKREKLKAEKTEAEAQRLATLAKHNRELEKVRMTDQLSRSGSKMSGGMKATVDERGKLVWE